MASAVQPVIWLPPIAVLLSLALRFL